MSSNNEGISADTFSAVDQAENVEPLVRRLAKRLPEPTQALLAEFFTVGEVMLAVEWVADGLAHRVPLTTQEREELLLAGTTVGTEAQVQHALVDCPPA